MTHQSSQSPPRSLRGLPGVEELLVAPDGPARNRARRGCFYSTVFALLVNSCILPLLLFPDSGPWQKIYFLGLAVR